MENELKTTQENREAFNALPLSEKIKKNREAGVEKLMSVGYITPDEAKTYREQLIKLPKNRKGLVVAYFLLLADRQNLPPTIAEEERIKDIIASFNLRKRGEYGEGTTLYNMLTTDEQKRWVNELTSSHIKAEIEKVETFIDAKRNRIRAYFLKFFPISIAYTLMEDEKGANKDMDAIPYLRENLWKWGYRGKGESLSEKDKEAIAKAASHLLDLIELAVLSGEAAIRYEEYKKYRNKEGWTETFNYRDEYDEALTEWETEFKLLLYAVQESYRQPTAKEALSILKEYLKDYEEYGIKGTKFYSLLEEAK